MTTYIIRRLIIAVIIILIVTLIVFFAIRLLPGDPLIIFLGQQATQGGISQTELEHLRDFYGLNDPIMVQYGNWVWGILQGDLGTSIYYHEDVGVLMGERFPITLHLGILAFVINIIIGVLMGVAAAIRRGTWIDSVTTTLANIGVCIPVFWLAVLMMYLFGLELRWLEVTRQDYIRTAWSKGLRERTIIIKHALKNGLIPVITLLGIGIGMVFAGSVFVETIFAIPGIGRLLVTSIFAQDYVVIQSGTLVIALIIILSNLVVDISYGWLDPRIRYG